MRTPKATLPQALQPDTLQARYTTQAPAAHSLEATTACLEQDSGFAGMTLGEGLRQYNGLVRCKGSDVAVAMVLPMIAASALIIETMMLPRWLFASQRQKMLENHGSHYPYEISIETAIASKQLLMNKLIRTNDLYQCMKDNLPKSNTGDQSQEAFTGMINRWAELGWVKVNRIYTSGSLFMTRKGFRALKQYTPSQRGPLSI